MLNNFLSRNFVHFNNYSSLEGKLNNNFALEEYLKDENAILCTKAMSKATKIYFTSEKIKHLIKFITEEPKEDDLLRGHKFPYVASEILKSDCPFILKRFILNEEEYYNEFKDILDEQKEENEDENGIIKIIDNEENKNEPNDFDDGDIEEINNNIF